MDISEIENKLKNDLKKMNSNFLIELKEQSI